MLSIKTYYQTAVLLVLALMFASCSTDLDDLNRYNIEGQWRQEGIYTYDLEGNLIDSKYYDVVWDVEKDSIEYTNSYYVGEVVTGILKGKSGYEIFPDGTFYYSQQRFKIDVITEDDFIYSIKRPDHVSEFRYYSID